MANATSSGIASSSIDGDSFTYRLIEAVKNQPCLYNPSHEHYGSKQANIQYRCRVWQKICSELGFNDGAHALQSLWKKIRDRYVRERKRRRNSNMNDAGAQQQENPGRERHPSGSSSCSTSSVQLVPPAVRQFEMMRWIDPYLGDGAINSSSVTNHVASETSAKLPQSVQSSSVNTTQSLQSPSIDTSTLVVTSVSGNETYYVGSVAVSQQQDPQNVNSSVDGAINNSFSPSGQQSQQVVPVQQVAPLQSQHDYAAPPRTSVASNSAGTSKSSTGSSSATSQSQRSQQQPAQQQQTTQQQQTQQQSQQQSNQHLSQHQPNAIILTTVPQHQRQSQAPQQQFIFPKSEPQPAVGQSVQTADGSIVTVTARGTAPMVGYVKKDVAVKGDGCSINSNTWLIDPTSIYQHGSQKMYRLVNLSDVNGGATLMSGLGPSTSEVKIGSPTRKKMRVTLSTQGLLNGRGQIGDDLIIDDGIAPKTVTIEQTTSPPIMDDGLLHDHNSLTVGGSSVMLSHHSVQQVHHQQHPTTSQQQQQPQPSSNTHHGPVTQLMVPHGAQINVVSTRHQPPSAGQRFIQQPVSVQPQMQYAILTSQPLPPQQDEEVEFTNSIAAHLSRLNEDEKAVAKMNIQRILMDARFGIGACARMIHEEEFNEAAVGTTVTHELTSAPQQHVDSSSRR